MNPFSETPIEILDDWNELLSIGCCCNMPLCAGPIMEGRWAKRIVRSQGISRLFIDREPGDPFVLGEWQEGLSHLRTRTRTAPEATSGSRHKQEYSGGPTTFWRSTQQNGYYTVGQSACDGLNVESDIDDFFTGSGIYITTSYSRDTESDPWELQSTNTVTQNEPADTTVNSYPCTGLITYTDPGMEDEPYDIGPFQWISTINPWGATTTESLENTINWDGWLAGALALLVPAPVAEGCYSYENVPTRSQLEIKPPTDWNVDGEVEGQWFSFRFHVPDAAYLYYQVTWDIGFFPPGYDEWLALANAREGWVVAVAVYEAWEIAHADWQDEYAAWEAAHAAWLVIKAAWEVEHEAWVEKIEAYQNWLDGERDTWPPEEPGDEPVLPPEPGAPIEPVEPALPGPEAPVAPAHTDETQPLLIAENQNWEWIGIVDPEDPSTSRSQWYLVDVPELPGQNRVVNVRFRCYRETPYGNPPPRVTGEGIDWPDP